LFPYGSITDALSDVLNLSEAMTYKNALCGINFGGGKSVIISPHVSGEKRAEIFQLFGRYVDSLGGAYITAEDMGTGVSDMEIVRSISAHVAGLSRGRGGGGDPSPYTASGVLFGIKACLEPVFGTKDLTQITVAIQGAGNVGGHLAKLLVNEGAKLILADIDQARVADLASELGAEVVEPEKIREAECDIFAPCAVGGTVDADAVSSLKCRLVAGAANNQLSCPSIEEELLKRSIAYAPDFAINAGGVILCADEFEPGGFSSRRVNQRVAEIGKTLSRIFDLAAEGEERAGEVAIRLAKDRISEVSSRGGSN
jgi:leucine dehydrogenase